MCVFKPERGVVDEPTAVFQEGGELPNRIGGAALRGAGTQAACAVLRCRREQCGEGFQPPLRAPRPTRAPSEEAAAAIPAPRWRGRGRGAATAAKAAAPKAAAAAAVAAAAIAAAAVAAVAAVATKAAVAAAAKHASGEGVVVVAARDGGQRAWRAGASGLCACMGRGGAKRHRQWYAKAHPPCALCISYRTRGVH